MLSRIAQSVACWALLLGGCALVALAVLCPLEREVARMDKQLALMRGQAAQLDQQEAGYRRFHVALASDDPVVLERLAYYQLRLKPAGTQAIALSPGASPYDVMAQPAAGEESLPTVEELLRRPLPDPKAYLGVDAGPSSRLDRLTQGWYRLALLAAGMLCIAAGMMPTGDHAARCERMRGVPVKMRKA